MANNSLPDASADLAKLRALGIDPDKLDIGPGGTDPLPRQDDREIVTARATLDYVSTSRGGETGASAVHPWVLASFQRPTVEALASAVKATPATFWEAIGIAVGHGAIGPTPVTVAHLGMGAPAAASHLEELIASGGQRFLIVGTANALQSNLALGSLVLPTGALREEGTSFHYVPPGTAVAPDADLVAGLEAAIADMRLTTQKGQVWTTDAPYRELASKVGAYAAMGTLAVEMECAALFAVAMLRGVKLASLLAITDHVRDPWKPSFLSSSLAGVRPQLASIATRVVALSTAKTHA